MQQFSVLHYVVFYYVVLVHIFVNKVYIAVSQLLVKLRPISRTPFGHESDIWRSRQDRVCSTGPGFFDSISLPDGISSQFRRGCVWRLSSTQHWNGRVQSTTGERASVVSCSLYWQCGKNKACSLTTVLRELLDYYCLTVPAFGQSSVGSRGSRCGVCLSVACARGCTL